MEKHDNYHLNFWLMDLEKESSLNDSLKHQILKRYKNQCLMRQIPLTKTYYRVSGKYNLPQKDYTSNLIFIEDFLLTAKVLWCSSEAFHDISINLEKIEGVKTPP